METIGIVIFSVTALLCVGYAVYSLVDYLKFKRNLNQKSK